MTKDIFDADLHYYLDDEKGECKECGAPTKSGKDYCSDSCFYNSMI